MRDPTQGMKRMRGNWEFWKDSNARRQIRRGDHRGMCQMCLMAYQKYQAYLKKKLSELWGKLLQRRGWANVAQRELGFPARAAELALYAKTVLP